MAIAGRVAIVPKGEWSQSVTYDKLDLVTYNGNTFIAYKSSVGVTPVDGDTWMLVMQGIDPQDIENIINGTTPVGDSNKLGGKGANEYALAEQLSVFTPKVYDGVTEEKINTIYNNFHTNSADGTVYRATVVHHVSHSILGGGNFTLEGARYDSNYGYQKITSNKNGKSRIFTRSMFGGTWNTWEEEATTADLANYLPKTGGTVKSLIVNPTGTTVSQLYNTGSIYTAVRHQTDVVNNPQTYTDLIMWENAEVTVKIVKNNVQQSSYNLLHTGNKPSGTYTGSGSNSHRVIATGGLADRAVIIRNNAKKGFALVTPAGAWLCSTDKTDFTELVWLSENQIHMSTNDTLVNGISTDVFTYWVL